MIPWSKEPDVPWLDSAPEDDAECRDFFVRLISLLSIEVTAETMQNCIAKALPSHGVKRGSE